MPPFSEVASVTIKSVARSDGCVERALRRGFRNGMGSWGGPGARLQKNYENKKMQACKLARDCLVRCQIFELSLMSGRASVAAPPKVSAPVALLLSHFAVALAKTI